MVESFIFSQFEAVKIDARLTFAPLKIKAAGGKLLQCVRCGRQRCDSGRYHHKGFAWRGGKGFLAILGLENQTPIDLASHLTAPIIGSSLRCEFQLDLVELRGGTDLDFDLHVAQIGHYVKKRDASPTVVLSMHTAGDWSFSF